MKKMEKPKVPATPAPTKVQESKPKEQGIEDLLILAKNCNSYLITISIPQGDKINHHLVTKNFPEIEVLKSLKKIKEMAVDRIENL